MNGPAHCCTQDDSLADAMAVMADKQVRRLAVVDDEKDLIGVISIADLVQAAKARATSSAPALSEVFETLRRIGKPYGNETAL